MPPWQLARRLRIGVRALAANRQAQLMALATVRLGRNQLQDVVPNGALQLIAHSVALIDERGYLRCAGCGAWSVAVAAELGTRNAPTTAASNPGDQR